MSLRLSIWIIELFREADEVVDDQNHIMATSASTLASISISILLLLASQRRYNFAYDVR